MTAATIPGLDTAPTKHKGLLAWVQEVAELTQPDRVVFADGSEEESARLTRQLVDAGTFKHLDEEKKPNSYLAWPAPDTWCAVCGTNRWPTRCRRWRVGCGSRTTSSRATT